METIINNIMKILIEDRRWNNEGILFCTIGTENECMEWVHKNTSHSFDYALKNAGYKIIDIE